MRPGYTTDADIDFMVHAYGHTPEPPLVVPGTVEAQTVEPEGTEAQTVEAGEAR